MKKLLLLLALVPLLAFGQKADSLKTHKVSFGLSYSPDVCYRFLAGSADERSLIKLNNAQDRPLYGFTSGINFAYAFNKKIVLEAGAMFSSKGGQTKKIGLVTDSAGPNSIKYVYHRLYIGLPVKVNINLLTGRAKLYVTVGVSPDIYICEKTNAITGYPDGHTITYKQTYRKGYTVINLAALAGMGFSYDISKHFYFKLEPVFRCSVIPVDAEPIKEFIYSAGLNTGFFYKL